MAVKYLSGNRLYGTNAERLALTTETHTQDFASLLSTYDPYFFLPLDEGTGNPANDGSGGSKSPELKQDNGNPYWTDESFGNSGGLSGGKAMKFKEVLSTSGWNANAPCVCWSNISSGTTDAWSVMVLWKTIGHNTKNFVIGTRSDPYNSAMSTGRSIGNAQLDGNTSPSGSIISNRFGGRAYY